MNACLTFFRSMEFSINFGTVKSGLSIVYIEGSQVIFHNISFSEDQFCLSKTVQTLMKCSIMLHFIWVFTSCQSTHLGVSGLQRVKYHN